MTTNSFEQLHLNSYSKRAQKSPFKVKTSLQFLHDVLSVRSTIALASCMLVYAANRTSCNELMLSVRTELRSELCQQQTEIVGLEKSER